jgi:hypothetical protein
MKILQFALLLDPNRTFTRDFPVKQNYVSLQPCDGMSEMRAATRNERGSIFLT